MSEITHDPALQAKINQACSVIENVLEVYEKPCILSSFGKDSMVMLHFIREWFTKDLPVVFFKLPYFQRKFAFAERQAADMELELHSDIPPIGISVTSKNGKSELVHHYGIGQKHLLRPIGKQKVEGAAKWLCARETLLTGPFGTFAWPWDVAFVGHKSVDVDPLQGDVPLQVDIHQIQGSCHMAYPLRHFTDEEIWMLTERYNIPVNNLRYKEGKNELDSFWNDDYFPYCDRCVDPNAEDFVVCPKTGLTITNTSKSMNILDPKLAYCGG